MNNQKPKLSIQSGFSMLEILISLVLGMTLTLIITYSYIATRRVYQVNVNMIHLQNAAYLAEQILTHEIRTTGFCGCAKLTPGFIVQHPAAIDMTPDDSLQGYASNQLPPELKSIANVVVAGTDIIVIKKMSDALLPLSVVSKHALYTINELIMIADCNKAKIFYYTADKKKQLRGMQNDFSVLAQVAPLEKMVFYISDTGRKTISGHPLYALYRKNLWGFDHEQTEIVEGVENMQIRYGIKSLDNHLNYISATQITDWSAIKTVKIDLLLTSMTDINYTQQPYLFMGEKLISPDQRLRKEWVIIIALRER